MTKIISGVIDLVVLLAILLLIVSFDVTIFYAIGGSLLFIAAIAIHIFISYTRQVLQLEFSIANSVLMLIIILNVLAYMDGNSALSYDTILFWSSTCAILLIILTVFLDLFYFYPILKSLRASRKNTFEFTYKIVYFTLFFPLIGIIFLICTAILFKLSEGASIIVNNRPLYSHVACGLLLFFFLSRYFMLKNISQESKIRFYESIKAIPWLKVYLACFILFTGLFGSMAELLRRDYFLLVVSIVFYMLFIMATVFSRNFIISIDRQAFLIEGTKFNLTINDQIKHGAIVVVLGTIYFVSLIILLLN
jgi:hypothetical protein